MTTDQDWEREEHGRWLETQKQAKAIEAGDFICPWCQRFVNPAEWWTHIEANPYEDLAPHEWSFGPTLFHKRCGAHVPDKNREWVAALRDRYNRSPIKPGDYVRPRKRVSPRARPEQIYRVIDIETDEYIGVSEDDPYYVLDISQVDPRYRSYQARRKELELIGRPYLKR